MEFNGAQADGDDYLRFLPSDDELSDDEPAAQPEDDADRVALALAAARISPALLLAPADAKRKPRDWRRQPLGDGVVARRAGEDVRVSRESMEQHAARRKQLLSALDACSKELSAGAAGLWEGDAPFRFARGDCEMPDASPKPTPAGEEMHAPEKKERRRGAGGDGSDEELEEDADPLYDERMDDADAKWVLSNFGGEQDQEAGDGMLCCPCCFVTVCMSCERHVKYSNQFRARSAVNCRVNKDEVLAYVSSADAQRTSLPFQKRLQASQSSARVLQEDEYYPVQCSDCNTTVGVFDHVQQFHFFNVLPSS